MDDGYKSTMLVLALVSGHCLSPVRVTCTVLYFYLVHGCCASSVCIVGHVFFVLPYCTLMPPTTIFRRAQSSRTAWLRVAGLTGNPLPLSLLVVSRSLSVYPSKKLQAVFSGFGPGLKLFFPGIRAHPSY